MAFTRTIGIIFAAFCVIIPLRVRDWGWFRL